MSFLPCNRRNICLFKLVSSKHSILSIPNILSSSSIITNTYQQNKIQHHHYGKLTNRYYHNHISSITSLSKHHLSQQIPPHHTFSTSTIDTPTTSSSSSSSILDYIIQGSLFCFIIYSGYQTYTLLWDDWPLPCQQLYDLAIHEPLLVEYFGGKIYASYLYENYNNATNQSSMKIKINIQGKNQRSGILYGYAIKDTLTNDNNKPWLIINAEVHIIDPLRMVQNNQQQQGFDQLYSYLNNTIITIQRLYDTIIPSSSISTPISTEDQQILSTIPTTTISDNEKILGQGIITIYNLLPNNKANISKKGFINIYKDIDTIESLLPSSKSTNKHTLLK